MTITAAFVSLSGGQGKTTSLVFTAAELAQRGYSVLVIDLDLQADATVAIAPEASGSGIAGVLLGESLLADAVRPTDLENVSILPATGHLEQVPVWLSGKGAPAFLLARRLELSPQTFDVVLIDTPANKSLIHAAAIGAANAVICPVEASSKGIGAWERTQELLDELREEGATQAELLAVIPCRAKRVGANLVRRCALALELLSEELGEIRVAPVWESEEVANAAANGRLPDNAVIEPYRQVVDRLLSAGK